LAFFYVGTVQPLDVIVIEDCFARLDGAKKRLHLIEQCAFEHAGIGGGGVHVIFKDVPPGEDQIVESSQRYKFVYFGSAAFGAPPQANGSARMRNKSPQRAQRNTEEFLRADSYSLWLRITCFQIHSLEWQIPVRVENLEAPLLLALVGFLIRKQLLL